jgi:hypothetical protein
MLKTMFKKYFNKIWKPKMVNPDYKKMITEPPAPNVSHSPVPQKIEEAIIELSFGEAMNEVLLGKKIHKLEWKDENYYGFINDTVLSLHKPDNKIYQWILSEGDISGTDYIVL